MHDFWWGLCFGVNLGTQEHTVASWFPQSQLVLLTDLPNKLMFHLFNSSRDICIIFGGKIWTDNWWSGAGKEHQGGQGFRAIGLVIQFELASLAVDLMCPHSVQCWNVHAYKHMHTDTPTMKIDAICICNSVTKPVGFLLHFMRCTVCPFCCSLQETVPQKANCSVPSSVNWILNSDTVLYQKIQLLLRYIPAVTHLWQSPSTVQWSDNQHRDFCAELLV